MPLNLPTTLRAADGNALFLHHWPRAIDAMGRGIALIVHGLGEHGGRYAHVAEHLNRWGWDVVSYDHRGHGRSGGARGRLSQPDDLLSDLGCVIKSLTHLAPKEPLLLIGHSMGGLVASRYVAESLRTGPQADWARPVSGLVLSSPALDIGLNVLQKMLLGSLGKIAPDLAVSNGLKPEWVCSDAQVVRAYLDDPLVHDRATSKLVNFMLAGGQFVAEHAAQWRTPTLLMYAGSDRCVNPAGSTRFASATTERVHSINYPHMAHEIFNEPDQATVLADLQHWLETHTFSAPKDR